MDADELEKRLNNWRARFAEYYACRPCFICDLLGACAHREPEVTRAELEWLERYGPNRRETRAPRRKPVQAETAGESGLWRALGL